MESNTVKFYFGLTAFSGISIFDIEYGINDKVVCAFFCNGEHDKTTRNMIRESTKGSYFIKNGRRYYTNNFLRL